MRARIDQGRKKLIGCGRRSETVDHQRDGHAARPCRDQRIADQQRAAIVGENIIIEFEAVSRPVDQRDQCVAQRAAVGDQAQMVAAQRGVNVTRLAGVAGRIGGRHRAFMPGLGSGCHGFMAVVT